MTIPSQFTTSFAVRDDAHDSFVVKTHIPPDHMLNNQKLAVSTHHSVSLVTYTIDDNNDITFTIRKGHHGRKIKGANVTFTATVVPRVASLQQKQVYPEAIARQNQSSSISYWKREFLDQGRLLLSPSYQRDFVWTLAQKQSYISNLFRDSAELKPTITSYVIDGSTDFIYEVIDGKQRLSTIFDYLDDGFEVEGLFFSELPQVDQNFLKNYRFDYTNIDRDDRTFKRLSDATLAQLFLEINLLGTRMSEDDLAKAQALLNATKTKESE